MAKKPPARSTLPPSRVRPTVVGIIPARLASTRLPNKVLLCQTGKPLIQHVFEAASRSRVLSRVVIAADDESIRRAAASFGAQCVMTRVDHPNGTSRLTEAARKLRLADDAIVVNIQGDEPDMEQSYIAAAVKALRTSGAQSATVAVPFDPDDNPDNPNIVKVVVAKGGTWGGRAMYFSRSRIPYVRDAAGSGGSGGGGGGGGRHEPPLRHVGLYAYRVGFLKKYVKLPPAPPEVSESLEQLRVLWHGATMAVAVCRGRAPAGIDTQEQYDAFVARMRRAQ